MFDSISWSAYFGFVALALLVYYVGIALIFYNRELLSLLNRTPPAPPPGPVPGVSVMGPIRDSHMPITARQAPPNEYTFDPSQMAPSRPMLENVMEETGFMMEGIKKMLEATGTKTSRAEIMEKVSREMAPYAAIADLQQFEYLINQFVIKQSATICQVELDEDDMSAIWKNLIKKSTTL